MGFAKNSSRSSGTCVIGVFTNLSAFASVEHAGVLWVKRYPDLQGAVAEIRKLGLVDRLFAAAAPQYIQTYNRPCIAPILGKVDSKKLSAAGFVPKGPTYPVGRFQGQATNHGTWSAQPT